MIPERRDDLGLGPQGKRIPDRESRSVDQAQQVFQLCQGKRMGGPGRHRADHLRADWQVVADHTVLEEVDAVGANEARDHESEGGEQK